MMLSLSESGELSPEGVGDQPSQGRLHGRAGEGHDGIAALLDQLAGQHEGLLDGRGSDGAGLGSLRHAGNRRTRRPPKQGGDSLGRTSAESDSCSVVLGTRRKVLKIRAILAFRRICAQGEIYFFAFFFAQYAFNFFDKAFRATADIFRRRRVGFVTMLTLSKFSPPRLVLTH